MSVEIGDVITFIFIRKMRKTKNGTVLKRTINWSEMKKKSSVKNE